MQNKSFSPSRNIPRCPFLARSVRNRAPSNKRRMANRRAGGTDCPVSRAGSGGRRIGRAGNGHRRTRAGSAHATRQARQCTSNNHRDRDHSNGGRECDGIVGADTIQHISEQARQRSATAVPSRMPVAGGRNASSTECPGCQLTREFDHRRVPFVGYGLGSIPIRSCRRITVLRTLQLCGY